jgi:hypothetical protein
MLELSWSEIKGWLTTVSYDLKKEKLDFVCGLSRGGLVPAVILSYLLDAPLLADFPSEDELLHGLAFKSILFVDDSEKNFSKCSGWIDPEEDYYHKFICLTKSTSFDHEDIWKHYLNTDEQVVFPWEVNNAL